MEHASGDTTGWEFIDRKSNGDLLSVTQREPQPLPIGQKVLVITGNQARVIPDYSSAVEPASRKMTRRGGRSGEGPLRGPSMSGSCGSGHAGKGARTPR